MNQYHEGSRKGFMQLFDYIKVNNAISKKIAMNVPILTTISY